MKKFISRFSLKHVNATTLCCLFLLLSCLMLVVSSTQNNAHPSHASMFAAAATDTAVVTETATVAATPTPTTPPPTPTPTMPPPTATPTKVPTKAPTVAPTQPSQQPTPTTQPGNTLPPGNNTTPTAKPTNQPKPSPTGTKAATPTNSTTPTPEVQATPEATTSTEQQSSADPMGAALPVGIGTVVVLFVGGLAGLAFMRKGAFPARPRIATAMSGSGRNSVNSGSIPWTAQPPATHPNDHPFNTSSISGNSHDLLGADSARAPMPAAMTPAPANPFPATPMPAFQYQPGDMRPLTTPMPMIVPPTPAVQRGSAGPARQRNPQSIDSLDFSTVLAEFDKEPTNPIAEAALAQAPQVPETPTPTAQQYSLVLPSIEDDPVLETIMRQAQMGIYAIPTRPQKEKDTPSESGINGRFNTL